MPRRGSRIRRASRLRTARKTAQTLHRQLRRKGEDKEAEQKQLYQKLVETTEQMVQQATRVVKALGEQTEPKAGCTTVGFGA